MDILKGLEKLSSSERLALVKVVCIVEKHPQSLAALNESLNSKAQILREVFDSLCKDSR